MRENNLPPYSRVRHCLNCGEEFERLHNSCPHCGGFSATTWTPQQGRPTPERFGTTADELRTLCRNLTALEASTSNKYVANTTGIKIAVLILSSGLLLAAYIAGQVSSLGRFIALAFGFSLASYIWIALSSAVIEMLIAMLLHSRASASLQQLQQSPAYQAREHFLQAEQEYEDRLRRSELLAQHRKEAFVSWRRNWEKNNAAFWQSLNGWEFENELAHLYEQLGYSAELTPSSGDEGVDIIIHKGGKRIIVQCKAHGKPVTPHVVRDLYGTLQHYKDHSMADEAVLASISGFTTGVTAWAKNKPIKLLSLKGILEMQAAMAGDAPPYSDDLERIKELIREFESTKEPRTTPNDNLRKQSAISILTPTFAGSVLIGVCLFSLPHPTSNGNLPLPSPSVSPAELVKKNKPSNLNSTLANPTPSPPMATPSPSATTSNSNQVFVGVETDESDSQTASTVNNISPPNGQGSAKAETVTVGQAPSDRFSVGSSKSEVLSLQGTPDEFTENRFRYGTSYVSFNGGHVSGWDNGYPKLKAVLLPRRKLSLEYFTVGSTKDDVLNVQGTPDSFTETQYRYGVSYVFFTADGLVEKWDNGYPKLRVKIVPNNYVSNIVYFTIGSTKDEVIAVQGTPDSFTPNSFRYGVSYVYFQNGRVTKWDNGYPKLKARLLQ